MLEQIEIKNFKSIEELKFSPGRLNIFIGENGCGKSNIIEALAFSAAANSKKLDNEFLATRGIRVVSPNLMCSVFAEKSVHRKERRRIVNSIEMNLKFHEFKNKVKFTLLNQSSHYSKWSADIEKLDIEALFSDFFFNKYSRKMLKETEEKKAKNEEIDRANYFLKLFSEARDQFEISLEKEELKDPSKSVNDFIIYSPENTALRNFYKEGQVEPLSSNGDGLLKLLSVINEKSKEKIDEIKDSLKLFGWFDSFAIPQELDEKNDRLIIKDRYTSCTFDQQSANEGFLFILFYIALIVSDDTPKIFAIDNIDASLNPKLCIKLISVISHLAKKYNKQIFATTHNPAILDGIDLTDDEQKLFVIYRKISGQTAIKRITAEKTFRYEDGSIMKLSDALMRGYIGGLPKGF